MLVIFTGIFIKKIPVKNDQCIQHTTCHVIAFDPILRFRQVRHLKMTKSKSQFCERY